MATFNLAYTGTEVDAAIAYIQAQSETLTQSGYQIFGSGLVVQWGINQSNVAADTAVNVTLPIAFPTTAFIAVGQHSNAGVTTEKSSVNMYAESTTQITYNLSASGTQDVKWIAVGH